jgi:hypothetical protein
MEGEKTKGVTMLNHFITLILVVTVAVCLWNLIVNREK